jgi:hypothetical protein
MSSTWIVLGLCVIVLLGAALPLLRKSQPYQPHASHTPHPAQPLEDKE